MGKTNEGSLHHPGRRGRRGGQVVEVVRGGLIVGVF